MKINFIFFLITINFLFLLSCTKNQGSDSQSFISNIRENELNHLKLDYTMSNTISESYKVINFTSDTIIVWLKIAGHEGDGMGNVYLYREDSTEVKAYSFYQDILITDTLVNISPNNISISFKKFTGNFIFQMNGK